MFLLVIGSKNKVLPTNLTICLDLNVTADQHIFTDDLGSNCNSKNPCTQGQLALCWYLYCKRVLIDIWIVVLNVCVIFMKDQCEYNVLKTICAFSVCACELFRVFWDTHIESLIYRRGIGRMSTRCGDNCACCTCTKTSVNLSTLVVSNI